ncbi:hypothetical protein A2U01_0082540 [Trifolium medium]|uniref:Uncharacterized protein n=1 Tax=Trifolium medium TaxID=97028 RepID=A0A392TJH4_9FABA|nr:hypothetical protein [Trifolium medium]
MWNGAWLSPRLLSKFFADSTLTIISYSFVLEVSLLPEVPDPFGSKLPGLIILITLLWLKKLGRLPITTLPLL